MTRTRDGASKHATLSPHAGEKKNGSPAISGSGGTPPNFISESHKTSTFWIQSRFHSRFKMSYEALRKHLNTPRRAKVQGAVEFLRAKGIKIKNEAVFQHFEIPTITDYRLLRSASRTRHNQALIETRGRKSKISSEQVIEADKILQKIELELNDKRLT